MSFLTGTLAGAVLAGGVYYSFSYRIRTGVAHYKSNLHTLSERMTNPQSGIDVPPSAAERLPSAPSFGSLVKQQWNQHLEGVFRRATDWTPRDS